MSKKPWKPETKAKRKAIEEKFKKLKEKIVEQELKAEKEKQSSAVAGAGSGTGAGSGSVVLDSLETDKGRATTEGTAAGAAGSTAAKSSAENPEDDSEELAETSAELINHVGPMLHSFLDPEGKFEFVPVDSKKLQKVVRRTERYIAKENPEMKESMSSSGFLLSASWFGVLFGRFKKKIKQGVDNGGDEGKKTTA